MLQSNSNSLFGSSNNLYGGNRNSGGGTPMFGGKSTPNKNLFEGNNNNSGGGMMGGGGGLGGGGLGGSNQIGTVNIRYQPFRNKENMLLASMTGQSECRNKCLDELRLEDYALMKNGKVPDSVQAKIRQNLSGGQSSGGGSLSNNLFGNSGGGGGNSGGGGGLFGNNNAGSSGNLPNLSLARGNVIPGSNNNSGGGLFGGGNNNNNNNSGGGGGGLFGGNNAGGGGGGGLLGNKGNTGGGMMGNNSGGGGGGLFGNNSGGNNAGGGGGGGLFGNKGNTGGGGGGLFGNNNSGGNNAGGGGGGLFGNKQGGSGGGGGLFGNQGGNNAGGGGGGGLFGNSGGNNAGGGGGGGLFGNKQGGTGGGGGLFGNQGGNNSGGGGGGLFGNNNNQGGGQGGGMFGNQGGQNQANPHLFANVDALRSFLENMDPSWRVKILENLPQKDGVQLKETTTSSTTDKKETTTTTSTTGNYVPYKPQDTKSDNKDQGYGRKKTLNEMAMSLGNRNWLERRADVTGTQADKMAGYVPFDIRGGKKLEENQKKIENFGLNSRRYGTYSVIKKLTHEDLYDHSSSYLDDRNEIQLRPKTMYRTGNFLDELNESQLSSSMKKRKNIYNDCIIVELDIYIQDKKEEKVLNTRIFKSATVQELKEKALEILYDLGRLDKVIRNRNELVRLAESTELLYEYSPLDSTLPLDVAGVKKDHNKLILSIHVIHNQAPKLTKPGYETYPPIQRLAKMSEEQLKYVENFAIWNEFGRIDFEGETDVRGLDLDELVDIQQGSAEVYPEYKFPTEASKPVRGKKLNKPAVITLYNCFRKGGNSSKAKKRNDNLKYQNEIQVLGYNETTGVYKMKVMHFTKYGFNTADSDDEKDVMKEESPEKLPNFGSIEVNWPQRRGIGFTETDKEEQIFGDSQEGSESGRLGEFLGDQRQIITEDDAFEEEPENYQQQFRRRYGAPGQKIIKGEHGRIMMHREPEFETETDGIVESGKDEIEEEEMMGERIEEEEDLENSQTKLLEIADNFQWAGRVKMDSAVDKKNVQFQNRCQSAISKLGILNRRVVEKSTRQINVRERDFSMHRSFRVGWSRDGFASVDIRNKISVQKIVIHRELGFENPEGTSFNYDKYLRNAQFIAKNLYEPLMRSLVNNNSAEMDEISNLSLSENAREIRKPQFVKFPDAAGLSAALIEYVEALGARSLFREDTDEVKKLAFGELRLRDVEVLSLLNILFGQCELDIWEYAINLEREMISESDKAELKRKLENSVEREKQNVFMRKHALSKWLERKSGQFVERDLMSAQTKKDFSFVDEILLYLSGRQIKKATEACNKKGLHRLAVLISTLSANPKTKNSILNQLKEWQNSRDLPQISHQNIHKFLSGETSVIQMYDFPRLFGSELWYLAKPTTEFPALFANFYDNKLKANHTPIKSVFWNEVAATQANHYELGFILIGLFAKHSAFSREKMLNPYAFTAECLDVKFLWIIEEFLSRNQSPVANQGPNAMNIEQSQILTTKEIEYKYRLLRSFCFQLELLGLWEYAVYALQVTSPAVISEQNRMREIRNLIQRNYKNEDIFSKEKFRGMQRKEHKKELLIERLGIHNNLLFESKGFKYLYSFKYRQAVKNLVKSKAYRRAYEVLYRQLTPIAVCNGLARDSNPEKTRTLLRFIERIFEILSTEKHLEKEGRLIHEYLKQVLANENNIGNNQESVGLSLAELETLANRINEIRNYLEDEPLGHIMIHEIRKDLATMLLQKKPSLVLHKHQGKVVDCLEKLDKGLKEDKTQQALLFVEKEASY